MSKERVLIVDDDEDLCTQLAETLQDEGFTVKYTSDSSSAEGLINENIFDIAIFDYKMQGMSGVDLLKIIKKRSPLTRIFVVSGRPFVEKILIEENVFHLIAEVLSKPFDVESLLAKLGSRRAIET